MAIYCTGTKKDKKELVAFLNKVFHEDFYEIMKKTYGNGQHFEQFHHLMKEQDRIVAAVGVYEQEFHIKDTILKTGFIGSVSVDEQERKKGYMKFLMEKAENQMRSDEIALAMLGGLRNRYGHWGYETGGSYYKFYFHEENIRHTIGWKNDDGIKLIPVHEDCSDFEETMNRIYELYRTKNMWCRERHDFYIRSQTWNSFLYEIFIDEMFAGYLVCNHDCSFIPELELIDWEAERLLRILRAVMRYRPAVTVIADSDIEKPVHPFTIEVQAWEPEKAAALQKICEHYSLHTRCSMKILDYPKALQAMLKLKQTYTRLAEGHFTIQVKEKGTFVMKVQDGAVSVVPDECAIPDLTVSEKDCINALISPASALYERQTVNGYPKGWFPLEFAPGNLDEF